MQASPILTLDDIYSLPDPNASYEQWQRWTHADLIPMSREALMRDRYRLRMRLQLDPRPNQWLIGRIRALERELTDPE